MTKALFHSSDLDGACAGAIVKYQYPECEMIGVNYGKPFPWDSIQPGETVYMVDFTLQPFELMEQLAALCDLVWIDHHKTEVEEAVKRGFNPPGRRRIGIGACALVWEYLYSPLDIPEAVRLLAEYDVFDHTDPRTLPFQYGFRFYENTFPDNQDLWVPFFEDFAALIKEVCEIGDIILKYEARQNAKFCKGYAFKTTLKDPSSDRELTAWCVNRGFTNSKVFDSVYDPVCDDLMITFCRLPLPAGKWTVSLYSTKDDIDCGTIARAFGGGGHAGAASFQTEKLPFEH
ncbi:MAG: hypothetical protein C4530_11435 [Desulfobacteraceae bacterium]|nr:MAG: hypothetical protein C4530_11435 [Desulfobacteraceae bacterium]